MKWTRGSFKSNLNYRDEICEKKVIATDILGINDGLF